MSRLTDLLRQVANTDPQLAKDLKRETDALADRRAFGLNFERHTPEAVELPGRPVRKNDKVRCLLTRAEQIEHLRLRAIKEKERSDEQEALLDALNAKARERDRLWRVTGFEHHEKSKFARVVATDDADESRVVDVEDLIVVAEFRDPIYPGLVSTGKVERGGDKPFHAVINAENYHALQALLFTHRGKVDCIYIDPPYNTGARDWKYNNDYVESDDHYRHSKWLAMMERRLMLAKELLNPEDSVLIVTIDEKEYLRLGLLLEQTLSGATIQMVSSVINPKGSSRAGFRRADEYIFFVMFGAASPAKLPLSPEWLASSKKIQEWAAGTKSATADDASSRLSEPGWTSMMRRGSHSLRADRQTMFYPIYVDPVARKIVEIGEPIPPEKHEAPARAGLVAVLPLRRNGAEGRWQVGADELQSRIEQGRVRLGRETSYGYVVNYLPDGAYQEILDGKYTIDATASDGSLIARLVETDDDDARVAPTQWKLESHNASEHGTSLLDVFVPGRKFNNPKSLYAVEDTLKFFINDKSNAVVLDFFSGSGTTAHAVARLNKQDGGRRRCISVTNNEVSADEQSELRKKGLRPGDPDWERWGICDYITKPRVEASITGRTPAGDPIKGDYKFTDEFPMADGFEENVEFFTLTYESAMRVSSNREFAKIAPFLWLRAGSRGRRIEDISAGWDVAEAYGVIANLDSSDAFVEAVEAQDGLTHAFIVTDEDRLFEALVRQLPVHVEPVRLYSSYLRNFEIEAGRAVR